MGGKRRVKSGSGSSGTQKPGKKQGSKSKPKTAVIRLTAKRREWIKDFKKRGQLESIDIGTHGWIDGLSQFLKDKDPVFCSLDSYEKSFVIEKWIKTPTNSWILRPEPRRNGIEINVAATEERQVESPGPPVLSPETSPRHDQVPPMSAPSRPTIPPSSPSEASTLNMNEQPRMTNRPTIPPSSPSESSTLNMNEQPSRTSDQRMLYEQPIIRPVPLSSLYPPPPPQPFFYNFGGHGINGMPLPFSPNMIPQQQQQLDPDVEKKKAYDEVFGHILGMGKYFKTVPELRGMLVHLNNISRGVTRSHHHFIAPTHGEVFTDYIRNKVQFKRERRSENPMGYDPSLQGDNYNNYQYDNDDVYAEDDREEINLGDDV